MIDQQGFIISRHWRDTRQGVELEYWLSTDTGPVQLLVPFQQAVFFLASSQIECAQQLLANDVGWRCEERPLKTFTHESVQAFYFQQQKQLRQTETRFQQVGLEPFEADIKPSDRYLMERFIRGSVRYRGQPDTRRRGVVQVQSPDMVTADYLPCFKVVSLDIETAMKGINLYSIAVFAEYGGECVSKVFIRSVEPVAGDDVVVCKDERALLLAFFDWLAEYDPDVIIGWNVINFDMWYLQKVCEKLQIPFRLGRQGDVPHWRAMDDEGERRALSIKGRVVLDGIEVLKAAAYSFESFSLNAVASEILGDEKLISGQDSGEQITELFLNDKRALVDYNIKDCKLVWDIFDRLALMDFLIARTRLTGLPLDRIGGSVASFDFRYLPLLHRQGFVAPNGHQRKDIEASPGGFVMDSKPGIYDHVLVLDFKSLYPSIIRSFKIDPMGMAIGLQDDLEQSTLVPGFKGAWFSKSDNILPALIAELWQSRDQAKANDDQPLSHAIKIIMNSFYGVLGSAGCRFFDARLASSITRRGHQIIQQTATKIEQMSLKGINCSVIYGDTDSVFVWVEGCRDHAQALSTGKSLELALNRWWRERLEKEYGIDSALELEFETHYQRFLMPTVRGSDQGSKKRYAGVIDKHGERELVFKGLENVRTDWTRLARDFQMTLYQKVFFDEPYRDYIQEMVQAVRAGGHDQQLVYRKRLRRKLDEYQRNIPPHVQAARKAAVHGVRYKRGSWVEYIMTVNGPEPVGYVSSLIDYQYYIDRQLAPVADTILYFLGESLASITDQQLSMF